MRRLLGGVLAAFMTTTVLILPTPAQATGFWTTRDAESDLDTAVEKQATVTCPDNYFVYSSGGKVRYGDGGVALIGVIPNEELTSVTAIARARPGHFGTWSVVASAVCISIGQTPTLVPGIGRPSTGATAFCPTDTIVYGTGYNLLNAAPYEYVDAVVPGEQLSTVYVRSGGAVPSSAVIVAFAICGYPMEHERTAQTVPLDPGPTTVGTAPEPDFGHQDAWVAGAGVQSNRLGMFIDGLGPNSALDGAVARMARAKTAPLARTSTSEGEEMTVYATGIGSWYGSPT